MMIRPPAPTMIIPSVPIFHFSSYWHTYSRILMMRGYETLEFSINPVTISSESWKNDIEPIMLRWHGTPRLGTQKNPSNDFLCPAKDIPAFVIEDMRTHLGEERMYAMLEGEFWEMIDFEKLLSAQLSPEHLGKGGVPISAVLL